jgi:hypothetical protein
MGNPNQANLPVSKGEKEFLDYARREYDRRTNGRTDWGAFSVLGALALLAGVGIGAALAHRHERNHVSVTCPYCNRPVDILTAGDRLPVAERYTCPYEDCGQEFIVQFHPQL